MKVTLLDMSQFARDVAGLLRLGYPVVEAVQKVADTQSNALVPILERSVGRLQKGDTLADSLKDEQELLPLFLRLLQTAEESEALPEGLERAALVMDDLSQRRTRCFLAVLYPAIVFTFVLLVLWTVCVAGGGLLMNLFTSMNVELPLPTRLLVNLSSAASHPLGGLLFFGFLALLWSVVLGRGPWLWSMYRVPLFGGWLLRQEAVIYLNTLGHLVQIGVPLSDAARLAVDACSAPLRGKLEGVPDRLDSGDKLSAALRESGIVPELGVWAVERREETESLRLLEIGQLLDRELELSLNRGLVVFEPLIFVAVLMCIGFFILAVFLPLYQLMGNLG